MAKVLVIVPTYNERGNILSIVPELIEHIKGVHILVVDDNSPDKTASAVRDLQTNFSQVHLLERLQKEGLGRAYVDGFYWAIKNNYDIIVQMDADHSHRVQDLKKMLGELTANIDFVIGSRWVTGGLIRNWDRLRWILSRFGNIYAQCILGGKIADWTGGFNIWRAKILQKIDLQTLEAQGYAFQIEMKYRALRLNFCGIEVPIVFEERRLGQSKMSLAIISEALIRVWYLKSKF
ncbi:MAG: dolichyl-phosphate beta-D-mannosyltransferase [Bdellovibrionales bacterium RBG_16_40_8]|nr:MAG: dolichyl-phosphate beta-D-mannosyltransferase [Bdellovibrionales bacterium RBG_16_40_8]